MTESEWQTRKQRIDARLRSMNPPWQIVRYRNGLDFAALDCHAVEELPTATGPADYGLFVGGKLLGIIEAKKVTVNPQNVLEQAKRYAEGAFQGAGNWNGYRVPFLYATNGEIIWHLDARQEKPVSRPISNFHTAPALEALFAFDQKPAHAWLLDTPTELIIRLRDYQRRCTVATEGIIIGGRRELLVAKALDQLEDERVFEAADVERSITAPDSNRKIIEEVAKHAYEHEAATGRFPKILIFAVNDIPHTSHADQLVRICRDLFRQGDAFVQKITATRT